MDFYQGSNSGTSRGRSSFRGSSSYRGSSRSDSFRGSRGSPRGYSGYSRGRGGSSYYPKHESPSPKYSSGGDGSKYGSSSYNRYDDCYRRSDSSFGGRDHRSDFGEIASRKRDRSESYSAHGAISRRPHDDDDYRSSRYSGSSYPETRGYEDSRSFKKPRTELSDYRSKEPLRPRSTRGRIGLRGSFSRRARGDSFGVRRRGTFSNRMTTTATTSEILAIRRAKLLQNRLKEQSVSTPSADSKTETKEEGDADEAIKDEKSCTDVMEGLEGEGEAAGEAKETAAKVERERTTYYGRPFMKLQCPSCDIKCITFREYVSHLQQSVHVRAMKIKSDELKTNLAAMRIAQRDKQKTADEEDLTSMNTRSYFCAVCKLNYSQEKAVHQSSELHKKLKEFLMPYCRTCRIQYQSPMLYENHLCSLEHLRRKHGLEERDKKSASGVLDNFMILDSVGSGDEADEKEEEKTKGAVKEEDLLLGVEFIRDVKAKYCEVCRMYLPRAKEYERILKRHCRTKEHLRCYLHFGNEGLLEKMNADEDGVSEKKDDKTLKEEKDSEGKEGETDEPLDGDKLWDGLSELLDEAQPRAKSDDEDEEEGGRFDRFKSKEKKENGDIKGENDEAADGDEVPSSLKVTQDTTAVKT